MLFSVILDRQVIVIILYVERDTLKDGEEDFSVLFFEIRRILSVIFGRTNLGNHGVKELVHGYRYMRKNMDVANGTLTLNRGV